jgi:hypothetical protein
MHGLSSSPNSSLQGNGSCVHLESPQLPQPFRTLSDYIPAVVSHLESRINAMEAFLMDSGHELTAVNTSSEADVVVAGRICHNAEATSTSIATLEIEGSRAVSSGARTKLDCSLLSSFSFFPGQIVGIVGRNPTGHCLTPHKVIDTMPNPVDSPLQEISPAAQHQSARVVIASGPFVPSNKLEFKGLHAVMSYCRQHPPDVLILCGPFIPDNHSELGNLRTSFQDLFAQQVLLETTSTPFSGWMYCNATTSKYHAHSVFRPGPSDILNSHGTFSITESPAAHSQPQSTNGDSLIVVRKQGNCSSWVC